MKTQIRKPVHAKNSYTEEFKQQALQLWRTSGRSAAKVGAELGIRPALLYEWSREHRPTTEGQGAREARSLAELEAEVSRLRAENAKLLPSRKCRAERAGLWGVGFAPFLTAKLHPRRSWRRHAAHDQRMPRALRLESENASYHAINRGNYKAPLFQLPKTKLAFLRCLDEACVKSGWLIHAWALMSNHFHLSVTTPRANLADGMHWLQCTFATRFNRFRSECGHVFQRRYTSLAVEEGDPLGSVCHYIHLNPVRAQLCNVTQLETYAWTSLPWILQPRLRPGWFDPSPALRQAGSLLDSPAGRRQYADYLGWLSENEPEQKKQRFDRMSRGWALGSADFARSLIEENHAVRPGIKRLIEDMRAGYEAHWHAELASLLQRERRSLTDLARSGKSVEWKVAIAAALKTRTTVTNSWLSENLHLGNRHEIGRKVAAWHRTCLPSRARQLGIPTPHPTTRPRA